MFKIAERLQIGSCIIEIVIFFITEGIGPNTIIVFGYCSIKNALGDRVCPEGAFVFS